MVATAYTLALLVASFGTQPPASASAATSTTATQRAEPRWIAMQWSGFVEAAASMRFLSDPLATDDFVVAESRARLDWRAGFGDGRAQSTSDSRASARGGPQAGVRIQADLVGDAVTERVDLDLRRAWAEFSMGPLRLRGGRQILTWGTGRYLFLNDNFPKDPQSFLIGRDDAFLFAPSDSLKVTLTGPELDLALVWNPVFAPDRSLTAERLSFFWPVLQDRIGPLVERSPIQPQVPNKELENGEWALRLLGRLARWELALYGYAGFFGSPTGVPSFLLLSAQYSRLGAYGASVQGPLLGGILSVEGVFRHSWDDVEGRLPFVPNSQVRGLMGFERSWFDEDFTVGVQYYLEWTLDHAALVANSPAPEFEPDQIRHVATVGLTFVPSERLTLDLFAFVSPSDVDAHVRPRITVKIVDPVDFTVGANVFFGRDPFTAYAQLDTSTHGYSRLRVTF